MEMVWSERTGESEDISIGDRQDDIATRCPREKERERERELDRFVNPSRAWKKLTLLGFKSSDQILLFARPRANTAWNIRFIERARLPISAREIRHTRKSRNAGAEKKGGRGRTFDLYMYRHVIKLYIQRRTNYQERESICVVCVYIFLCELATSTVADCCPTRNL